MKTAKQKVEYLIIDRACEMMNKETPSFEELSDEAVEQFFDLNYDEVYDAKNEIRSGDVETEIPCDWSRHYESKSVAAQLPDGSWVGWTYWYGGGKHGEPEAVEWIGEAYDLNCTEEEKLVVVRRFYKSEVSK